jgi:hypothetical protein
MMDGEIDGGLDSKNTTRAVAQRQLRNVEESMYTVLSNWIYIGSNAYDEYTFVPWLNRNVYRRTVDLARVCLL